MPGCGTVVYVQYMWMCLKACHVAVLVWTLVICGSPGQDVQ